MRKLWVVLTCVLLATGLALAASTSGTTPTKPAAPAHQTTKMKVDINTASKADLEKLPGIGDAYAEKIIAGRPYKAKDDLLHKKVLPKATYDKVSSHIVAHQG
jgi:DNA uptake protein ComE-like DNA-binding protein